MPTRRKSINNGNIGGTVDFKIQSASDGSGQYIDVVALDGTCINVDTLNVGTVDLTYNSTPPTLANGQVAPIQGDSSANLKVVVATSIPAGSNTVGKVDQGIAGTSAWKVDPSGVTSPVSIASLPALAAGTNTIGGTYPSPTASSAFAIAPGSSSAL